MTKIIPNNKIEKSEHLFEFAYDEQTAKNIRLLGKLLKIMPNLPKIELRMIGRHPDRKMLSEKYGIKNYRASIPLKYAKTVKVYAFTRNHKTWPINITPTSDIGYSVIKMVKLLESKKDI